MVGIGAVAFLLARLELPRAAVMIPIAITLAGVALIARVEIRRTFPPAMLWIVTLAMTVTYGGVVGLVIPALEERKVG